MMNPNKYMLKEEFSSFLILNHLKLKKLTFCNLKPVCILYCIPYIFYIGMKFKQ